MKQSLNNLVKEFYSNEKINKVKDIVSRDKKHLMNYKILALAVEDDIVNLSKAQIKEFYHVENVEFLSEVDYVIADLITALSKLMDRDIKRGYDNALMLDRSEPEFEYLLSAVRKHLSEQ